MLDYICPLSVYSHPYEKQKFIYHRSLDESQRMLKAVSHSNWKATWLQLLFDRLMLQIAERWTPAEGWIEVPSQSIHPSSVCVSVRNGRKGPGLQAIFLPEKVSFSALTAVFSVAQGCWSSCNQWEAELSRDVVSWETGGFASLRHRENHIKSLHDMAENALKGCLVVSPWIWQWGSLTSPLSHQHLLSKQPEWSLWNEVLILSLFYPELGFPLQS